MKLCRQCGEDINPKRSALGYSLCLLCGEEYSRSERESWCIVQEYTKGNYQLVTPASVATTLKQTNPKESRI